MTKEDILRLRYQSLLSSWPEVKQIDTPRPKKTKEPKPDKPAPIYHHSFYNRCAIANSRARKVGVEGIITPRELKALFKASGYQCVNCGSKWHLTADHIIPLAKMGMNTIDNIQVLCRTCNLKKGDRV